MIIDVMKPDDARVSARLGVIDRYISFTWIDRYYSAGEFALKLDYRDDLYSLLAPKNVLYLPYNGKRAQYITSRVVREDDPNHYIIEVKGKDPRILLQSRILLQGYPMDSQYFPSEEIRAFLNANIGTGAGSYRSLQSVINFSIPSYASDSTVIYIPAGVTLDEAIRRAMKTDRIGWRLNIPTGDYPTTTYRTLDMENATGYPNVVFSREHDSGKLTQIEASYPDDPNWAAAYGDGVFTAQRVKTSSATGPIGLDRYEGAVNVSGVKASPEASDRWEALLTGAAINATAAAGKYKDSMEFEAFENSPYRYGIDYDIGDTVRVQSNIGNVPVTPARVIEYVRSDDASGFHEYPVLSV